MYTHSFTLLKRLAIVLVLFSVCRLCFYGINYSYFSGLTGSELLRICFFGLRFDISAIVYCNLPLIVLHLIPTTRRSHPRYQRLLELLFLGINATILFLNCVDLIYFRFTLKRTTADVLSLVSTGNDFTRLLPRFILDYWYIVALWLFLVAVSFLLYQRTKISTGIKPANCGLLYYSSQSVFLVCFLALSVIGARGGLQLKPISPITAGYYTQSRYTPLVLNTPFSMLRTFRTTMLEEKRYFEDNEVRTFFSPVQEFPKKEFQKLNVVVIILESLSREYVGSFNGGIGYTPFLDSLAKDGLIFDNAFANGKNSVDGIPAILAGLPSLMRWSYILSPYSANQVTSLANILKSLGYDAAFYHGGENGTMGFDVFCGMAGFNRYYGRSEYNNDSDNDGHWGIWDEEFFQYFATHLNNTKPPFLGVVFSLSSHHPYKVPERYVGKFKKGPLKIHEVIGYTDYSLQRFFEVARTASWYDDTLFVITADHTAEAEASERQTRAGMYSIPIIFYRPNGQLRGTIHETFQQIDIMPTVLDYLHYSQPFYSFGTSAFSPSNSRFAVSYLSDVYQYIDGNYVLYFDGEKSQGLYNFRDDPQTIKDLKLIASAESIRLESSLKGLIQTYNHALLTNSMVLR